MLMKMSVKTTTVTQYMNWLLVLNTDRKHLATFRLEWVYVMWKRTYLYMVSGFFWCFRLCCVAFHLEPNFDKRYWYVCSRATLTWKRKSPNPFFGINYYTYALNVKNNFHIHLKNQSSIFKTLVMCSHSINRIDQVNGHNYIDMEHKIQLQSLHQLN